jgi:hypothetical protein
MPQVAAQLTTANATGNREKLIDAIYLMYNNQVPFTGNICGRVSADAVKVEWLTDDMPAPNPANAVTEGGTAGTPSSFNPARVQNTCQLFEHVASVSDTQEAVNKAGRGSEVQRQKQMAVKKLLRDMEAAALSSSQEVTSGNRRMRGLSSWLSTNTAHNTGGSTSGVGAVVDGTQRALTKPLLEGVLQSIAQQGGVGGEPMTILAGAFNKRIIDSVLNSSGINDRNVQADKKTLVDAVQVWESSYGPVKLVYSAQQTTDAGCRARDVFIVQDNMYDMAFLQPLGTEELARNGHGRPYLVKAEATLIARNERSSGKVAELTTA